METSNNTNNRRPYDRESHVLIVDDDSTLLKFFKIHLNKFFSKVIVVENGKEALATMKEKEIDLIVSDVRMPRLDGLELLQKVRKNHPDIPFLLFSGEPMSDDQQEKIALSDGFIAKGFSVDELNHFIEGGIDLRYAFKSLLPLLKDPKKIREAIAADSKHIKKFFKPDDFAKSQSILEEIQGRTRKAG